jgi:thymidylate synthase
MICHLTNLQPENLSFCLGDAHIYKTHIEQCKEMIVRDLRQLPTLKIIREVKNIDDFKFEDFEIVGYNPHPTIKAEMAV